MQRLILAFFVSALSLSSTFSEVINDHGAIYDRSLLWPANASKGYVNLHVCWLNAGRQTEKQWVRDAVRRSWQRYAKVNFTGWSACMYPLSQYHVVIHISDRRPFTYYGKTSLQKIWQQGYSMSLNFDFRRWPWKIDCQTYKENCIKAIAIHEFGHVLGLAHESERRDTPWWCSLFYHQRSSSQSTIPASNHITAYDKDSVMNYCSGVRLALSPKDIYTIRSLYGTRR